MNKYSFLNSKKFQLFVIFIGFFLVLGCQKNKNHQSNNHYEGNEIRELKAKIYKLEKLIETQLQNESDMNMQENASPIRSITFRIGSKDDRLRIYWLDGSKTDLPCTKEQSIWACG